MTRFRLSAFALFATLSAVALADPVDDIVDAVMKQSKAPGFSLLVVKDGKVIKSKAYGFMTTEQKAPVKPDTIYETGSIGKTFTATVVMQLVGEGKLKLEDPISKYIPEAPEAWKDVTIRRMITQQSGLPEYALIQGIGLIDTFTREQFFAPLVKLPLDFVPGTQFQYSNTNFALLGYVIEKVTGKPYGEIVKARVFDRAGMKDTQHLRGQASPARQAAGYLTQEDGSLTGGLKTTTSGTGADGGFISTTFDLVKFAKAIDDGTLLPKATVALMKEGARTSNGRRAGYGYAWFVRKINGKRMVSHGGNSVGYSASLSMFPDSGLTIALMSNIYPISGDNIARQIAEVYDPSLSTKSLKVTTDPHPKLTAMLLKGAKALADGKLDEAPLDPDFANLLATGRGQMMRGGFAIFRQFQSLEYLMTEDDAPDRIERYRAKVGDRSYSVAFVVSKDNKIYSMGARAE